jgi:hypothetical protein
MEGIRPLFKLQKLIELDLTDNPVVELLGYRETIFKEYSPQTMQNPRTRNT